MDEEQNILPQISDSAKKEERSVSHGYQGLCSWVSLEISGCFDFYLRRLKKGQFYTTPPGGGSGMKFKMGGMDLVRFPNKRVGEPDWYGSHPEEGLFFF